MKKRIIVSTMASVMAINAVSSMVASADFADVKTMVVNKAQLQDFVENDKELVDLVNGGIEQYGTVSGEKFMNAYEYASAIAYDEKASANEVTAAWLMLKAAKDKLGFHTKEELQGLIRQYKGDYDRQNQLNEYDLIYTEDSYNEFVTAYVEALDAVESDDRLVITDAYEKLDSKGKALNKLDTVKKSDMHAAKVAFEEALKLEFAWQPWARCKVPAGHKDYKDKNYTWGALYAGVKDKKDDLMAQYANFDAMKGTNETSNVDIVNAVKNMKAYAENLTSFKGDLASGYETQVNTLLKDYSNRLVYDFGSDVAAAVAKDLVDVAGGLDKVQFLLSNGKYIDANDLTSITASTDITAANKASYWNVKTSGGKTVSATLEVKLKSGASNNLYYVLDKNDRLYNGNNPIRFDGANYFYATKAAATAAAGETGRVMTLSKGLTLNLTNYLGVDGLTVGESYSLSITVSDANGAVTNLGTGVGTATAAVDTIVGGLSDMVSALENGVSGLDSVASASEIAKLKAAAESTYATFVAAVDALSAVDAASVASPDEINASIDALKAAQKAGSDLQKVAKYGAVSAVTGVNALVSTDWAALDDELKTAVTASYLNYANAYLDAYNDAMDDLVSQALTKFDGSSYTNNENNSSAPDYTSSKGNDGNKSSFTHVSLPAALLMAERFKDLYWADINLIDNTNMIVEQTGVDQTSSRPRTNAWKLLYNYLKYALADRFGDKAADQYGLTDVEDLIKKADTLAKDTIETALFEAAHNAMVKDRTGAREWTMLARDGQKAKAYIDAWTEYNVITRKVADDYNSHDMYNMLNDSYKWLTDEKNAFAYSYEDIITLMANVAKTIDEGKLDSKVLDDLKKKLLDTAYDALTLGTDDAQLVFGGDGASIAEEINGGMFNNDGTINVHNRLFTLDKNFNYLVVDVNSDTGAAVFATVTKNNFHLAVKKDYEGLDKAYQAAIAPPKDELVYDVDGKDGVNVADAVALLDLIGAGKTDVKKHDYDKSGRVDVQDVVNLIDRIGKGEFNK